MRIRRGHLYAILTGDVVGSSRLGAGRRRALPRALERCGRAVRAAFPGDCPLPLQSFRGDGWQLLLQRPAHALRLALHLRAMLRVHMAGSAIDSRVAIGIGQLDFVPGEKVSEGDGAAYRLSGGVLEGLDRRVRMGVAIEPGEPRPLLEAVVVLTDALVAGWTMSQARAVAGALEGRTQERIAGRWKPRPVTQQAVQQHLDRGRWHAVERGVTVFEADVAAATEQAQEIVIS